MDQTENIQNAGTGTAGTGSGGGAATALDKPPTPQVLDKVYFNVASNDPNAKGPAAIQKLPGFITDVNTDGTCDLSVYMKGGHQSSQTHVRYGLTAGCWQPLTPATSS